MKSLRILILAHPDLVPPDNMEELSEEEGYVWKTEYDVMKTLRNGGHEVSMLGVQTELAPIRDAVENWKPDIVFNLLEEFHGETLYAQNVVGLLELLRVPYTGCNPRGLMLARGKDLSKKLLKYHRVPVPAFGVFPIGAKVNRPGRLKFPLIVKSLWEDASLGIAQASIVYQMTQDSSRSCASDADCTMAWAGQTGVYAGVAIPGVTNAGQCTTATQKCKFR
jgi:D-alanine-D-alanine ligase